MTVTLDTLAVPDEVVEERTAPRRQRVAAEIAPVRVPAAAPPAPPRTRPVSQRSAPRPPLTPRAGRVTAAVLFTVFVIGVAVQPLPDGPQPVAPWWVDAVSIGTLVALMASWGALSAGRRSGLWAGVVGGAGLLTMTVLCPAVDHHTIAAWWWVQLALGAVMTAVAAVLLATTRSVRR